MTKAAAQTPARRLWFYKKGFLPVTDTPSVIACGDATFPKGTALVAAAKFPATTKGAPLGELPNEVRLRGYFARKKAPGSGVLLGAG